MSIFGDHRDLDSVLISFLDIDDLRNLYQVNKYYHDLIKPKLQEYIDVCSQTTPLEMFHNNAIKTNNINIIKYVVNRINPRTTKLLWRFLATTVNLDNNVLEYLNTLDNICDYTKEIFFIFDNAYKHHVHIDVIEWYFTKLAMSIEKYEIIFKVSCKYGRLDICQRLIKRLNLVIYNTYFYEACIYGQIKIVEWLLTLDPRLVHNDDAFRAACANKHLAVIDLLCSLVPQYKYTIEHVPEYKAIIE